MLIRNIETVKTVDWGNGLSRRFVLDADGLGYSVTDTTVRAGTKSRLEYRNHLETCYCIEGSGEVVELDGTSHPLTPGVLYSLDNNDPHFLIASPHEDLRLVCVFAPALQGDEVHSLAEGVSSAY
ncbi:ectoine synthase [Streptomyces fimicarius]|uniref:L-ectoine synthase n=1 Tax=Streptomyces caviscabies TaxID=90079 RepID=A0ABW2MES8_9ACTN|nr:MULTISPECIES: ectoine synthase [Streptomyces]MCL6288504.1 ectoine synthase [Streptomyces sp. 43Y-GA-1]MCX4712604.1 ectoine synthase [Streptomyces griseus]MDX2671524.1 ectoine synthase [Streptomyces sp. NRRL_ISP-5395]MDX3341960.1 ectoine synthase [Streptomyces sp. ME02-6979.5a]MDX3501821.1 ectoine synthase [Streptomyces sp. ATCC51928]